MKDKQTTQRNYETIAWGAFFIWWGITEMFQTLPEGAGAIGIGLILLGLNAARALNQHPVSGFTTTLGFIALVLGGLLLAKPVLHLPFELPVLAFLLITLGIAFLASELRKTVNS